MDVNKKKVIEQIEQAHFKARKKVLLQEQSMRMPDSKKQRIKTVRESKAHNKHVNEYQNDKIQKSIFGRW